MAEDHPYPVGYKKPPENSRFKKGQSGNPAGRPKGSLGLMTILRRTLHEPVVINENGQRKRISKLEAASKQLVNQAAGGDLRAVAMLLALAKQAEEGMDNGEEREVSDTDKKIMENLMTRFKRSLQNVENADAAE